MVIVNRRKMCSFKKKEVWIQRKIEEEVSSVLLESFG